MNPTPATIADVLVATRRAVMSLGLGNAPTARIVTYNPARTDVAMYGSTDVFLVSPGPEWSWAEGESFAGDSIFLLDGQLFVEYWHRDERDEAMISEQFLADPIFGTTGTLTTLLARLNDDGSDFSTLQDANGNSPLFRPLTLAKLLTPTNTKPPWSSFTLILNCQLLMKKV